MDPPREDRKASADERTDTPDFDSLVTPDELVRGERTRDDFFDAVLQLSEPTTVDDVAALAGHGTDAAREYLEWFERMGIVERVSDSPATYRRRQSYLTWRRVERLRDRYRPEELVAHLESEIERERELAEAFDAELPDVVSVIDHAETADLSIEETWRRLSEWRTIRRRIELLERALATEDELPVGRRRRAT